MLSCLFGWAVSLLAYVPAAHAQGLYLRLGLGVSGVKLTRDSHGRYGGLRVDLGESHIAGGALATEISIGGFLSPRTALVGTLLYNVHGDAHLEWDGNRRALNGNLDMGFLGVGVDHFFSREGGLHLGGALGVAGATAPARDTWFTDRLGGIGIGASLFLGYDHPLSRNWSLGLAGRFTVAGLRGEVERWDVVGVEEDVLTIVSLVVSLLYR